MKVLIFNLKKEYFEQIKSGIKTEEYRLCTPYWQKRLEGKTFDKIIIKLGYPKNSDAEKILEFKYLGYEIKTIKHKHFGNDPVKVYAIKIIQNTCIYCNKVLTEEETEYYHNTCENCEIEIHEKLINELRLEKSNKNYVNS